jgi:hypothetical protein
MSSPRKLEASTRGTPAPQRPAQIFAKLKDMAQFYLGSDLNDISAVTISKDRAYLVQVYSLDVAAIEWSQEEQETFEGKFKLLKAPIKKIISCFYKALLYIKDKGFEEPYYDHMLDAVDPWKKIRDVVR